MGVDIKVTPLGAGQDVGRSCVLVSMGGRNIMFDCGMHMGYSDEKRYPDFSFITTDDMNNYIDAVIITHFHLDHCGALPYFTEMVGYKGPIFMTHPTKAICPHLLEDMRKVSTDRKGETNIFTSGMIKDCMKKVTTVYLHQTVQLAPDFEIKPYYAGHVLGAALFYVRVGNQSVVYTGDYNMTPDRHLGAAWIDKCKPDLLITESTYATTIRESKRCRERDLLKKVHDCIERGGKVLIPVFALGRAQELCILLETYWDRMNLQVPIYFAVGLTETANNYYKMFITWTNEKIRKTFVQRNMFDFKHIKPFDKGYMENPGAMVVFATPGMLHGGLALQIFKRWAPSENNMVIMPGYCVQGTVGHKILNGFKKVEIDNQVIDVKLQVQYMSFSAHADAKGILQLISYCEPRNIMLVHGEKDKMEFLQKKIVQEFSVDCYYPANGETVKISCEPPIPLQVSLPLVKQSLHDEEKQEEARAKGLLDMRDTKRVHKLSGVMTMSKDKRLLFMDPAMAETDLGLKQHSIRFTSTLSAVVPGSLLEARDAIARQLRRYVQDRALTKDPSDESTLHVDDIIVKISESDADEEDMETDAGTRRKEILISWELQVIRRFAKILADSDPKVRSRGIKRLKLWMQARSRSKVGCFSYEEMMRVWRALFFSVWMSDKPLIQEKLCDDLSGLILVLGSSDAAAYLRCCLETVANEWNKIDKWRFEKFLMLIRRMIRKSLEWSKQSDWAGVPVIRDVFAKSVLKPEPAHLTKIPLGLKLHVVDVFLEEMAKVGGEELAFEVTSQFLEPFLTVLVEGRDYRMVNHVVKRVFEYLVLQSDVGLKHEAERQLGVEVSSDEDSDYVEDDLDKDDDVAETKSTELDPRAGRVDTTIPQLAIDFRGLANRFLELAQKPDLKQKNRSKLYRLNRMYLDVSEGIFPKGVRAAL
ncbi:unnamed protein product [Cyprideis torosa]|uniref:Integrator complex subunit 11 n=1 Tax=Cyprideis torosa TaxID=163714 RepID=A0A7R8ZQM4_9CRUS|nr:unnamed protein product [Cyprideis torosa]CAG0892335.1 unnamed protein product [Cyprideis torosa]